MPNKLKYSVVIPFYEHLTPLLATLRSLALQDVPHTEYEVIVVNDGGPEHDLANIIEGEIDALDVRCLRYQKNRGAAFARNHGWRQSNAEIIIFLDGDQLVKPDFIRQHGLFIEHNTSPHPILQMGLRNEISSGDLMQSELHPNTGSGDARLKVFAEFSENMQNLRGAWHLCFSHNLSVKREVLEELGGFDEGSFNGWGLEDCEFSYNLHKQGVRIAYNPNILVYHISHPISWNSPEGYERWNKNLNAFINKHPEHPVLMQCIFRDFFNPEVRQERIEGGEQQPWLNCFLKFEESIRCMLADTDSVSRTTLVNPSRERLFAQLENTLNGALTVFAPKDDLDVIVSVQTQAEARRIHLHTY